MCALASESTSIAGQSLFCVCLDTSKSSMTDIDASIAEASVIQRQIPPLVTRMLDGLEQFINLDMPFDLNTRLGNIEAVRANMDRSDVTSAEAFRQVLEL